MNKEDLLAYRAKLAAFSEKERQYRDLYLKGIANGTIQGPVLDKPSINRDWMQFFKDNEIIMDFPEVNMKDYILECNKDNMDGTAINFFGKKITYNEFANKIEESKKAFAKMGVKEGDTVTIASPFFPEAAYSIYALTSLGAKANMIDPRVTKEKFENYFKNSKTDFVVAYGKFYNKIKKVEKKCNIKKTVIISPADTLGDSMPLGLKVLSKIKGIRTELLLKNNDNAMKWNEFIEQAENDPNVPDAKYDPNRPAVVVYTSGTTGETKGAVSSNKAYNALAAMHKVILGDAYGKKFLLIMPPFIAYGLAVGLHSQLARGEELIMEPRFNIKNQKKMLGKLVMKYKPQIIMGVPTFIVDMINHRLLKKADIEFLEEVIVGGDGMIPESEVEVDEFFEKHNCKTKVKKGWGLTEVNSAFSFTVRKNDIGSVGTPLIGNEIMITKPLEEDTVDIDVDELEEVGYNETGEIWINSKSTILNYLNNEEEAKRVFYTSKTTGIKWVRTKDLGSFSRDGQLKIDGRLKRIIIRPDGHNISPFAIEKVINENAKVKSCAVVGRPVAEGKHGSCAIAYIQLKNQYKGTNKHKIISQLKNRVEKELPPRDVASEYKIVDEIPLTDVGKVNYKILEENEKKLVLKRAN